MTISRKKRRWLSALQLIAAVAIIPLWLTCGAAFSFEPISTLSAELRAKFPPPEWAHYYLVGGGKVSYWRTTPLHRPIRLAIHIGALATCVAFTIGSALYFERIKNAHNINLNRISKGRGRPSENG